MLPFYLNKFPKATSIKALKHKLQFLFLFFPPYQFVGSKFFYNFVDLVQVNWGREKNKEHIKETEQQNRMQTTGFHI